MSVLGRGTTALDRLRDRYDSEPYVCAECGHRDESPGWEAVTTGTRVVYRRECESCGARTVRACRLGPSEAR